MKPWMAAVVSAGPQLVTLPPITSSQSVLIPFGVSSVDLSGYGARGTDAVPPKSYIFETQTIYVTRRSDGGQEIAYQSRYIVAFTGQTGYCNPATPTPSDPVYSSNQICYGYDGFFTDSGSPATTGASTTGFGKTFPGSTGNVAQTPTTFTNVAVTGGQSYNVIVPAGGSLTISYYR